jgi:ABC-type polysaccharide/polyol phosphate export permease
LEPDNSAADPHGVLAGIHANEIKQYKNSWLGYLWSIGPGFALHPVASGTSPGDEAR